MRYTVKNKINKFFIYILTFEIVFLGGGRLLDLIWMHAPSLRYILFGIAVILAFLNFLCLNFVNKKSIYWLVVLFAFPLYGTIVGALNFNETYRIWLDLRPMLYVFILIYFISLNTECCIFLVNNFFITVKIASVSMALLYLLYLIALWLNLFDFDQFYFYVSSHTDEIFFRPGGYFFAKSFFFMALGSLIFLYEKKYNLFLFTFVALVLTATRGPILSVLVCFLFLVMRKNIVKGSILFCILIVVALCVMFFVGERAQDSDAVRIRDILFVLSNIDVGSIFLGNGFGSDILGRTKLEVALVEMFWKTGFLGVTLSFTPIIYLIIKNILYHDDAKNIIGLCLLYIVLVSLTNPFMFTPMGYFIVCLSIASDNKHMTKVMRLNLSDK